jgi:hypothetical protein
LLYVMGMQKSLIKIEELIYIVSVVPGYSGQR